MIARTDWLLAAATVWSIAVGTVVAAPEPPAGNVPAETISQWIAELDSSSFAVREAATRRLIQVGRPAVEPLARAAEQGGLEVAVRVISILKATYTSGKGAAVDAAELALERLVRSKNRTAAKGADTVLSRNYQVREKRAIIAIRQLGGVVEESDRAFVNPNDPTGRRKALTVHLTERWRGGDDGLKYLKRLTRLAILYRIEGSGVTDEGLQKLRQALPHVRMNDRGPALLGVGGIIDPNGRAGCWVSQVKPGSAAAKAGIRTQDVITHFDGKHTSDFDKLVELISTKKPGDKVKVVVLRGVQSVTLDVVLTGWSIDK